MHHAIRIVLIGVLLSLVALTSSAGGIDVDDDQDGWTELEGDCCDVPGPGCSSPALVNPGAMEVAGNGVDDNCDGTVDEPRIVCDAGLPSNATDGLMYAKAMDLCQTTTENPPTPQRGWGVISAQLQLADGTGSPAAVSRSIRQNFGSSNSPQFGINMSILSSGHAASSSHVSPAFAAFQPGQALGGTSAFPADWFSANGNRLPRGSGCPSLEGVVANDPVMLKLRIRAPTNARSFSVSTRFFSADYPEYVCSPYNDFFLVLLSSGFAGSPANPNDGNVAVYGTGNGDVDPIGFNVASGNSGLLQACMNGTTGCAPGAIAGTTSSCTGTGDLVGTGFDTNGVAGPGGAPGGCDENKLTGAGTSWLTTRGNVVPGETIEVRFAVWDTSDGRYDSLALIDNFEWSVDATAPGTFIVGNVPAATAPAVPTGVMATAQTATSVLVTWNAAVSATSYQVFRRSPAGPFVSMGRATATTFTDTTAAPNTAYLYGVRAMTGVVASPGSASDLATTLIFADDPLVIGGTAVKAMHLSQLRTGINAVRQLAGLEPAGFTDSATPGVPVKAVHITEIRSALDGALGPLGFLVGGYTDSTLAGARVKALHFQEIRNRLK